MVLYRGFQISSMHKLQEGLSAHYHPLFRRDIPKRASEISLLQPRNYLAKAKKAKKKPDLMSNAQLNAFISNSMADAVSHSSRQEGADKSRSRFLYPYHGSGSPSALAVARAPETSSAIVTNVSQSVYGNISTSIKNAATGTERHGPSSYAITPGRGDFRNLNQTRDVHLRSPTAHTPNSFRRNNDRAANIVSPEQRNLAIKADLTKRMTSSVEEDQLIQQQLNQIRLNASLARSPLDILEAKAEFDRLTAQQMKLRERIMELDSLLRLCREAELQQQQAEELARRNQERLKGERAMKDENLRRQRLASALFGGTTTEAIDSPTVLNGSDSVNGASYSSTTAQVINDRDRVNISLLTSQSRSPAARSRYHESYESTAVSRVQGGNWVPASRETSPQDLSSILQRLANCRYR